jgi:hypothetical protein
VEGEGMMKCVLQYFATNSHHQLLTSSFGSFFYKTFQIVGIEPALKKPTRNVWREMKRAWCRNAATENPHFIASLFPATKVRTIMTTDTRPNEQARHQGMLLRPAKSAIAP